MSRTVKGCLDHSRPRGSRRVQIHANVAALFRAPGKWQISSEASIIPARTRIRTMPMIGVAVQKAIMIATPMGRKVSTLRTAFLGSCSLAWIISFKISSECARAVIVKKVYTGRMMEFLGHNYL